MRCLGIESTAHTFSCSVVELTGRRSRILSDIRSVYKPSAGAGIHPREASSHHAEQSPKVLSDALNKAKVDIVDIDAIAYASGPGLGPCLRVGAVVARSLAGYHRKPLVPVNHAIGHLDLGKLLTGAKDPLVLLVSGGHSMILALSDGKWRVFGETLDITVGQLLDQFGRTAGFASPCGSRIEEFAAQSNNYIPMPYAVKGNDVSYSGLLSAAKRVANSSKLEDVCFSLQETAFAMITEATERALAFCNKKELLVVGGVAANKRLRSMLSAVCKRQKTRFFVTPIGYAGDCGAQIAWTGILQYRAGISVKIEESNVRQSWRLDTVDITWKN